MKKLETERLILHPISEMHISNEYVNWLNDEDIYKYLESRGNYSIEKLKSYIKTQIKNKISMWGIHLKNQNTHIGNIKIDPINIIHGYGEYGILIGNKTEWGKGYAKEASEVVFRYFFNNEHSLRKINLGVVSANIGAIKLYKSMGFNIEGVLKNHVIYNDVYYDIVRMALFNPNYKYD